MVRKSFQFDDGLFEKHDVKRGLRNSDGPGRIDKCRRSSRLQKGGR